MKKRVFASLLVALGLSFSTVCHASEGISTNTIAGWPAGPEITSTAAVVMEDSTNTILYAKNMDQPLYPASAVKIMTCLLTVENCSLSDPVTITDTGLEGATDGGANIAAQLDETFTVEQCLYAVMVASANDIALQLAEHVGGSVDTFVQMMNARAQELGCTNTLFTNPTGMPDENQHVTAHDMALITQAAIRNDTFRPMFSALNYTIPATNVSGGDRVLSSSFTMTNSASDGYYEGCIGGKEGFTEASGSVLMCAASRNGMTLIAVVLNGASGQTDDEAITILDYGFGQFRKADLGKDDFSVLSGGTVILPAGIDESQITFQDAPVEGRFDRTYYYGEIPIGTAVAQPVTQEDPSLNEEGTANLQAARAYSQAHSNAPYYLIAAAGILLLLLLIRKIIKIAKS